MRISSSYSAAMEDKLRAGTMHIGFQSFSIMSSLTSLIYNTMTLDILPSRLKRQWTCTILCHPYVSIPLSVSADSGPLHDGTMSWDSLQTMSFAEFRDIHSGLKIPVADGANPLLALWQALHNSPSREKVFADLHPLLYQASSLNKFAATPSDLTSRSLSGPALGMAPALAYAISGLAQTELCDTIYGMHFREDLIQILPLSDRISADFFLNRWVWVDLSTESILLVPLKARVLDVKRAEAQLARYRGRASWQYPPRWQDVTLRFAAKVFNLSSKSVGDMNAYSMNGTGRLAIMPAREPRRTPNRRLCLLVNCVFLTPI